MNHHHSLIKLPVAELKIALSGLTKVLPRSSTMPVLGMIHVEWDRSGWVHLTATDLGTFLSLRLEAPAQMGEPASLLVPFVELQKLGKTCPADARGKFRPPSRPVCLARRRAVAEWSSPSETEADVAGKGQPRRRRRPGTHRSSEWHP